MRNVFLILFLTFILSYSPTPVQGYYNPQTDEVYCTNAYSCLHEEGHQIDKNLGWPSKSDEWKQSIDIYRLVVWEMSEARISMSKKIEFFPGIGSPRLPDTNILNTSFWEGGWGGYTELYAEIYAWSDGDINRIPASLRSFYKE